MTDDYRARLEALDVKRQRVHTQADLALVSKKAPGELCEDDLTQIGFWCGERAVTEARARREKALHPAPEPPAVTNNAAAYVTRPALMKAFEHYSKETAPVLLDIFKKQKSQIDALAAEVETLKARSLPTYAGVHVDGQAYSEAQLVTRAGGLWLSTAATSATPGTPGSAWRLVVKRGGA